MSDLEQYKEKLFNSIAIDSDNNLVFPEESFFEYVTQLLSETGILDNVEYAPYRNTRKGLRLDGFCWNPLERTFCGILVDFTNDVNEIQKLTNTDIVEVGKRGARFFESCTNSAFVNALDPTDPGRIAANELIQNLDQALKFRVVLLTDKQLSARVKALKINPILGKDTSIEVWDLQRVKDLDESDGEYEDFIVDFASIGHSIRALPANISEHGLKTYLAVMPATALSAIYDTYGQRLLESNVRTFLDFRATTNRGMRRSLVTEPEHFFAYNNGLTVTATDIETETKDGHLLINALHNMQIVNGGQTTAAIYFSPREKGGITGAEGVRPFSQIDLSGVYVQMKLTVIGDKTQADVMKANIATFANSQNAIQLSDLQSNHPFHLNLETRSRSQLMPAGELGYATKWFYERARGQYSTKLRALSGSAKSNFERENPKKQVFTKTDMAKYENTWRMRPHIVKKGAQANLKALGEELLKEFEKDETVFGAAFYQDLIAKMILFRTIDSALLQTDWYKNERGLKAEIVTFSIALIRHALVHEGRDIDLAAIYRRQKVSESLCRLITDTAKDIREKITDIDFTDGVTNPSEFCKSERGWKKIKTMHVDTAALGNGDVLSNEAVIDAQSERKEVNSASNAISIFEYALSVSNQEWDLIAEFNKKLYPSDHKYVVIPRKCASMHHGGGVLSDRQLKTAKEIRDAAYAAGFEFV